MIMLSLKENSDGFELYFKEQKILDHSNENPCVQLGNGGAEFKTPKRHSAYFKIKDMNVEMSGLKLLSIESSGNEKYTIEFSHNFKLICKAEKNRLIISPTIAEDVRGKYNRFWIKILAHKDEAIYGCGEQLSKLNLKGKTFPLWTQEPGLGRDHSIPSILADLYMKAGGAWYTTYYPQATFLSSRNYFVHIDSYAYGEFRFKKREHELYLWEIPEKITIDIQNSATDLLTSLTELLGRQPPLPDWAVDGVWLGIGGGLDESKSWSVPQKVERALENNIKVSAVWSQDWTGLYHASEQQTALFWNWRFDPERYPNLPEYIEKLHKKDIHFLGYNNCFLMKHGDMYKEVAEKGYLVKNEKGEPYDIKMIHLKFSLLDLSNPDTWNWIKSIIKKNMLDMNLDGWMCDYGEYLPVDSQLNSEEDPKVHHNKYPVLWAQVNHEAVSEWQKENNNKPIVYFNRSGNAGTSKYTPLMWAGDQMATFSINDGLASVICGGISMGFVGIGHYHSDIGGLFSIFFIKRKKEVFQRWTEMAAFTPVMRTHEGHEYKTYNNWKFDSDQETLDHFAKFSRIHSHLLPYTRVALDIYQKTGIPLIRHPYIHYENDLKLHKYQYQYLYGRDLLVAPVYKKRKTRWKCYLPHDNWIHLWTHEKFSGGKVKIDAPIGQPPVFFREESKFKELFEKIKDL